MRFAEVITIDGDTKLINIEYIVAAWSSGEDRQTVLQMSVGSLGQITIQSDYDDVKEMLEKMTANG